MFGRVRVSCSSPDDLERPTSKLLKHDSLSIYESTLLKLKVGSQNASSFPNEDESPYPENDSMTIEDDCDPMANEVSPPHEQEPMALDNDGSDPSTTTTSAIASNCPEACASKQARQLSVTYLFSRFKSSRDKSSSPDKRMKNIESNCSVSISPTSSNYQCIANVDQEICIS